MKRHEKLLSKIESAIFVSKTKKSEISSALNITPTTFSAQLRNLKQGKNIPLKTIFKIEEITGVDIFNI